ncbi:MAG TPA: hypothetical protein VM182_10980 [Terriglobia bacterium]|nr:hypothetical protein [Terriglobia bacterium]
MSERPEFSRGNIHLRLEGESRRSVYVDQHVEAIEIDLSRPRLIRILGRTSNGRCIERHLKITDKERLVMV